MKQIQPISRYCAILLCCSLSIGAYLAAQTYQVDEHFGEDGVVRLPTNGSEHILSYKLLIDGNALYLLSQINGLNNNGEPHYRLRIDKLDVNGKINPQFGQGGQLTIHQSKQPKARWDLSLCDAHLFVLGQQGDTLEVYVFDKQSGSPIGYKSVDIAPHELYSIRRIRCDSSGITLSGTWVESSSQRKELFLHRLQRKTLLADTSWGTNHSGWVVYGRRNTQVRLNDIAFHGHGLVVYGFGRDRELELGVIFKLTATGEIDRAFGTFRNVTTIENFGYHPYSTLHVDGTEKVYLFDPLYPTHVLRYTSKGKPDTRYGFGGVATHTDVEALDFRALGAFGAPDGRVYIVGYRLAEDEKKHVGVVLGYTSNGAINTDLGQDGYWEVEDSIHLALLDGHIDDSDRIYLLGTAYEEGRDISKPKGGKALYLTRLVQKTSNAKHLIEQKPRFYIVQRMLYSHQDRPQYWEEIALYNWFGNIVYRSHEVALPLQLPPLPTGLYVLRARSVHAHCTQLLFIQ